MMKKHCHNVANCKCKLFSTCSAMFLFANYEKGDIIKI